MDRHTELWETFMCPDCGKFIKSYCPKKIKLLQRFHQKTCENKDKKDGPLYIQDQYEDNCGHTRINMRKIQRKQEQFFPTFKSNLDLLK